MSEPCNHDCSSCGADCASREPESLLAPPHELSDVKKVIGVVSGKGGVGKSLVTSLLAVLLQRRGLKVGILDADITGPSIPRAFGLREKATGTELGILPVKSKSGIQIISLNLLLDDETEPVVWRGPIIAGVVKQFWSDVIWKYIDVLLVDMPPGTGDVPLTVYQSLPIDGVVVATSPQQLVGMVVEKAVNMAHMMDIPILGLVENMAYVECPDCGKRIPVFGESRAEALAEKFGTAAWAQIPLRADIASMVDQGVVELLEFDYLDNFADAIEAQETAAK